jgi:hypothetical protein
MNSFLGGAWITTTLSPSINWGDSIMHLIIVVLAVTVLSVSFLAYQRRRSRRYLLLSLGFFFLFLSQFATLLEVILLSNALIIIPSIGLHLSHVFDFLTLIFFMLGISGYGQGEPRGRNIEVPSSGISSKHSPVLNAASKVQESVNH